MSRSGYSDDYDDRLYNLYRGAVRSAIRGKRGQKLLRELADALDAMPEKRLIEEQFESESDYCALGVLAKAKGIDVSTIDPECAEVVASTFGIADAMAREIVYINDETVSDFHFEQVEICGPVRKGYPEYGKHHITVRIQNDNVDAERWETVRQWVENNIISKD